MRDAPLILRWMWRGASASERCGPFVGAVENTQDANTFADDPIDGDVGGMGDHQFTSAADATYAPQSRVIDEHGSLPLDFIRNSQSRSWTIDIDVVGNLERVPLRRGMPLNLHAWTLSLSALPSARASPA